MTDTERLNRFLAQEGIGYKALAQKLHFHRTYAWKVVRGKQPVSANFRFRFATVFGQYVEKAVFGESILT